MSFPQPFGLSLNEQRPNNTRFLSRSSFKKDCKDDPGFVPYLPHNRRFNRRLAAWACKYRRGSVLVISRTNTSVMPSCSFIRLHLSADQYIWIVVPSVRRALVE